MTDEGNRKREESRRVFSEAAPIYDRIGPPIFSRFGQRLVDVSEMPLGANVLDVAAGRGAVLFPAAAKVGTSGRVIGIDFTTAMVRETAKDIASRKIANAEIRQMDAEQMEFDDAAFDCVTCGFALWMFAEPARVLAGISSRAAAGRTGSSQQLGGRITRPKLGVMKCFDPLWRHPRPNSWRRKT